MLKIIEIEISKIIKNIVIILLILINNLYPNNLYSKENNLMNYYNVKYIDNYDGDTATFEILIFKNKGQEIYIKQKTRFKNINAEEIRNEDLKKKEITIRQKEELKEKLLNAKSINLLNCDGKEKYGRLLCDLDIIAK